MSSPDRQPWDSSGVAASIESYWRAEAHEQLHREGLADLVCHCLPAASATILEVGCGSGLIYGGLGAIPRLSARYVGVDSSIKMLAIARRSYPGARFVAADGYRLPFGERAVDVTLCFEVLGHLPEVEPFLAELARVTRQIVLFTIWPSEGPDVLEGHEEVEGVFFPHRAYSDNYIRRVLARLSPGPPRRTDLHVLSADCWAYALHLAGVEPDPLPRVAPFRSFHRRTAQRLRAATVERERHRELLAQAQQGAERAERAADALRGELATAAARLDVAGAELTAAAARLDEANTELVETRRLLAAAVAEAAGRQQQLERAEDRVARWQRHAAALGGELAALRGRRLLRVVDRFRPAPDLSPQIAPAFRDLLDDSFLFLEDLRGYRLQPSEDLWAMGEALAYSLRLARPNLSGLQLAPIVDVPETGGSLGIELASPDGVTVARARVPLAEVNPEYPTRFSFAPIPAPAGSVVLRITLLDTTTARVRLFEWRRRRLLGFGGLAARPFCALVFA
ncbi:MAG TPA: class I SAM-dependent methyltransferase [Candidatus Binatia bacterium]|nr:class I SAM-dependent methyltransferase [Candidatus Binatia bacterium]